MQVPVLEEHTFLRTVINGAQRRFQECLAIVENAPFPSMRTRKLPISGISRLVNQSVASKIRSKIAFQPLRQEDAEKLDTAITRRVQQYYDWVFKIASKLLCLPLEEHGFDFISVASLNRTELIVGQQRDLNHRNQGVRDLAQITLADLQCSYNHCRWPLQPGGLSLGPLSMAHKHFPITLIELCKQLTALKVSIFPTCQDYIYSGDVGIKHLLWSRQIKGDVSHSLRSLADNQILTLAELSDGPVNAVAFKVNQYLGTLRTKDQMIVILHGKPLAQFVNGPADSLLPRDL